MRDLEYLIGILLSWIIMGYVAHCILRHTKWNIMNPLIKLVKYLLLSKIVFYVVIAIMILSALSVWVAAESSPSRYSNYGPNGMALAIGFAISFSPYFIVSIALAAYLSKRYRRFLKKGKSTTVDQIASSLRRDDVGGLRSELQHLIDRGYLTGIEINHETNVITPISSKDAVQELGRTVNKTISAFKNNPAPGPGGSICKKCGAAIPDDGSTNCEFCGAPISR